MATTSIPDADPLWRVQAYRLAMELVELAKRDVAALRQRPGVRELRSQLLRSAGSIAANVAEGYSRTGVADRRKFYEYALGSAREVEVWYATCGLTRTGDAIARLSSIRRLLLVMIKNTRA